MAEETGRIVPIRIEDELKVSYLDYAMSVIVSRALPDVRDGLKPVHRRILYTMHEMGLTSASSYRKCAAIVGEVMGKYHPHGDVALYDALVRLAQTFSLRYPLIDGQGNFGSVDGDPPAAMRYCITGDTRVATSRGTVRIDSIVPDAKPESDNEVDLEVLDRKGLPVHASMFFHSGTHPTLRLRTSHGHELTGSHNHPVLCLVNFVGTALPVWKLLAEIRPGDRVVRVETASIDRIERWERGGTAIMERIASVETRSVIAPLVTGDHLYAEVESVTDAGLQPVYSLRVDTDDHSFITNGFVSHNTEARMTAIAAEVLADIDKQTVDFVENYDGTRMQPSVLPAKLPNLLVNGSAGIAVGMATNIPPHHLGEITSATIALIDDPELTNDGLCNYVNGPDFPTGATIFRRDTRRNAMTGQVEEFDAIREMYAHGRGRVVMQATVSFEETRQQRTAIVVTELPFQVNKATLAEKIADLVQSKKVEGIADIRDESDRDGMRLVIECKRDAAPRKVLNNLFKHTALKLAYNMNMLALVDGQPQTLPLKQVLQHHIDWRREVVRRRTEFDLGKARDRAHILEGLKIALDTLDAVIRTIRESADVDTARQNLISRFKLTEIQANAILEMQLRRLAALERKKIEDEYLATIKLIAELEDILGNPARILAIIKDELIAISDKYAGDRLTKVQEDSSRELTDEDLIADEDVVVTVSTRGYIKRQPLATYRRQIRGGKGIIGARTVEEDAVAHLLVAGTHDWVLFFTNRGRVFSAKVHAIPAPTERTSKGMPVINLEGVQLEPPNERVLAIITIPNFERGHNMVMATRRGVIKKTPIEQFERVRSTGIRAITVADNDELTWVGVSSGSDDIVLATALGRIGRFNESEVRPMGRDAAGVIGIRLAREGDQVVGMGIVQPTNDILVLTATGYGKRVPLTEFRRMHRGSQGVRLISLEGNKTGQVAAVELVDEDDEELLLISSGGQVVRTDVQSVNRYGSQARGVIVMRLNEGDEVAGIAVFRADDRETVDAEPENGASDDQPDPPEAG